MAFQILFVVEADKKSRSDYIYIRSVLDRFFNFRLLTDVKINAVFMGGKSKYQRNDVISEINKQISAYSRTGKTHVVYCFDTDKYDTDPEDKRAFTNEEKFCKENGYDFVWFCHDIEEVFLGKSVPNSDKTKLAIMYSQSNRVEKLKVEYLNSKTLARGKSNLIIVLEKYLKRYNKI